MGFEKRFPGTPLSASRCGINPVRFQDVRDRPAGHLATEVRKCALDPRITPRTILTRHANDECGNV